MFEIQLLEVLFFKKVNVKKKLKPHMFLKKTNKKTVTCEEKNRGKPSYRGKLEKTSYSHGHSVRNIRAVPP